MSGYYKGIVEETTAATALPARTLVGVDMDEVVNEKSLISSLVCTWALDQLTGPQGPLFVGVAHSDYSDAEIEAVIEAAGTWDRGNKIARELAKRLIRTIGSFGPSEGGVVEDLVLNNGLPIKTKLNWMLQTGDTLKIWIYNSGDAAVSSTIPIVRTIGHANLWSR